jgi:hypothetical protein
MRMDQEQEGPLAESCRRLVSVKYRVDDWLDARRRRFGYEDRTLEREIVSWVDKIERNPGANDSLWLLLHHLGARESENSADVARYALRPSAFVKRVLPGARIGTYRSGDVALQYVDPSLVIGGTYSRRWPETLAAAELDQINESTVECGAQYEAVCSRIGALPLYVAFEGKNRVRAFLHARKDMAAFVYTGIFPGADALELHEVEGSATFAVSSKASRGLRVLILPSVTVPLLTSYGVPWGRRIEPGRTAQRLERARREALVKLVTKDMSA